MQSLSGRPARPGRGLGSCSFPRFLRFAARFRSPSFRQRLIACTFPPSRTSSEIDPLLRASVLRGK